MNDIRKENGVRKKNKSFSKLSFKTFSIVLVCMLLFTHCRLHKFVCVCLFVSGFWCVCCVTQREKERLRLHMKSWFQCNLTNVYVILGPKWICSIHVQGYEECTVVDFCLLFLCASVEATSTMHCISSYLTVKCVCMNMTEVSNVVYLCIHVCIQYVLFDNSVAFSLHLFRMSLLISLEYSWGHEKTVMCVYWPVGCVYVYWPLTVCVCIGLWLYVCVLAYWLYISVLACWLYVCV